MQDLARFSRNKLIEPVDRLFGHIQALEAGIAADLEGSTKAANGCAGAEAPPSLLSRPLARGSATKVRSSGGSGPTALPAPSGGADPPGGARHGQLPRLPGPSDRREGAGQPPGDYPASGRPGTGNRACGARTWPAPRCRKRCCSPTRTGAHNGGSGTVRPFGADEVSMLREECRLPFRVIPQQRYLKWRFGLRLSVGELVDLVRGAAERGQEEYTRLRQEIRRQPGGVRGRNGLASRWP